MALFDSWCTMPPTPKMCSQNTIGPRDCGMMAHISNLTCSHGRAGGEGGILHGAQWDGHILLLLVGGATVPSQNLAFKKRR